MNPRGTLIAALLVVELAIIGEAFVALHIGQPAPLSGRGPAAQGASGPHLIAGGPHQIFDAGAHPALIIDIGYADLTILTSKSTQIDVSLSTGADLGPFTTNGPIAAREDGDTVRVTAIRRPRFTMGDDRMVTVVVPAETRVTVVKAGDIKATGLRAEASFSSAGNGSIAIEDYDAPALHVESSSGPISLHQVGTA